MSCETTNRSGSHDCGVPVGWKPDVVSCRYIHAHAATTAVSRATSLLAARMRLCQRRASAATRLDMCRVTAPRRRRRAAGVTNATAAVRRATSRMCPKSAGAPTRSVRSGACYNCGGMGHISRDCSSAPGAFAAAGPKCYNCGHQGHISRDCSQPPQRSCYSCGSGEHLAAHCPQAV